MHGPASSRLERSTVALAVVAFAVLGLSESGLGTAWPSMRVTIGRPIADLGTLLAAGLVGYATASALAGRVMARYEYGRVLVAASVLSLAGLITYAASDTWGMVLVAAVLLGVGGGTLDTTMNAYAAHHFSPGEMNLLHAGFGVGATLSPIVMALVVAGSAGWPAGYVVFAIAQGALLLALIRRRRSWLGAPAHPPARGLLEIDRLVVLSLLMFFLYTGIEVATGQWSFSVLTESRDITTGRAGLWVASYWAGLTIGRLGLSAVATRLGPARVMAISVLGSIGGAVWFWADPSGTGVVALPAMGASLAGIFPTLVTLTPARLGAERTNSMVGYQLAAASLGAAALPWLVGRAVAASSLAVFSPLLVAATLAMGAAHLATERSAISNPI
jgi:fucose permease